MAEALATFERLVLDRKFLPSAADYDTAVRALALGGLVRFQDKVRQEAARVLPLLGVTPSLLHRSSVSSLSTSPPPFRLPHRPFLPKGKGVLQGGRAGRRRADAADAAVRLPRQPQGGTAQRQQRRPAVARTCARRVRRTLLHARAAAALTNTTKPLSSSR